MLSNIMMPQTKINKGLLDVTSLGLTVEDSSFWVYSELQRLLICNLKTKIHGDFLLYLRYGKKLSI